MSKKKAGGGKESPFQKNEGHKRHLELLAPGGSFQSVQAAFMAGADAVYMGGSRFSARAYAESASENSLEKAIDYAHLHDRQLYLTLNTLLKPGEMEADLYDYVAPLYEQGLDGILVQDLGVLRFVRREFPELPVHASTQMTVTSAESARLLQSLGLSRVVAARELNLKELREIYDATGMELEAFVHGAICYCYSGKCLYSSLIGGRSGNRGRCAQPCRLPYTVKDSKGQVLNRKQDNYLLSLKDMCTLEYLPQMIRAGVMSFKIEGRMKSPLYTAGIVSIYRKYLDTYLKKGGSGWRVEEEDLYKVSQFFDRGGFTHYLTRHNGADMIATREKTRLRKPDASLMQETENQYLNKENKEKINAFVSVFTGEYVNICVDNGRASVSVQSEEPIQTSISHPLTEADVRKQMGRLGNTPYELNQLEVMVSEDAFMPVRQMNELRRRALEALTEETLKSYRRKLSEKAVKDPAGDQLSEKALKDPAGNMLSEIAAKNPAVHIHVAKEAYLPLVMKAPAVSRIYVDAGFATRDQMDRLYQDCKACGKELFLRLPLIHRGKARSMLAELVTYLADGVCACTLDSLQALSDLGYDKPVAVDASLYLWNKEAKAMLAALGESLRLKLDYALAPLELHHKELQDLGCEDMALYVYGHQPMMTTANCLRKTTGSCLHKDSLLTLTDRKHASFPVECVCRFCYNIIYNSLPCYLLDQERRLKELSPRVLYGSLTVESLGGAGLILSEFDRLAGVCEVCPEDRKKEPASDGGFTRGHFLRGVQ